MRVEQQATGLLIRAARNNLSSVAKESLVRYLAVEGFIADSYRWHSEQAEHSALRVRWVTDTSWLRFAHHFERRASLVWAFLTWGRLLAIALFIGAFAVALWLKAH